MSRALDILREERVTLLRQLKGVEGAITALTGEVKREVKRELKVVTKQGKKMSAATKAKIAKAAKARWAKIKGK
jgi:hypothetical protein